MRVSVDLDHLTRHVKQGIVTGQVPQLAECVRNFEDLRVTPYLDLGWRPEQAECLGIVSGKSADSRVPLYVILEFLLPSRSLLLRNDISEDDTSRLSHRLDQAFWQATTVLLDRRKIDFGNRLRTLLGYLLGFHLQSRGETMILNDSYPVLGLDDGLFQLGKPFFQKWTSIADVNIIFTKQPPGREERVLRILFQDLRLHGGDAKVRGGFDGIFDGMLLSLSGT